MCTGPFSNCAGSPQKSAPSQRDGSTPPRRGVPPHAAAAAATEKATQPAALTYKLPGGTRTFACTTQFDRLSDEREDPYNIKTLHSPDRSIDRGSMVTTAQEWGKGVDQCELTRPKFKRVSVTKEFFRAHGVPLGSPSS